MCKANESKRTETTMSILHVEERRHDPTKSRKSGERLPAGYATAVIAGLSLLCWTIIVAIALALRSVN